MFINLAHRGASEYAPENTLAAFYKAVEMGANGIETDLKVSKDGVILLHHDDELNRTTNGSGPPSEYTWSELAQLDAGSWFGLEYAGERLVTLEQFLYLFGRKNLQFAIELKDPHLERQALDLINHYEVCRRAMITSFAFDNLVAVRNVDSVINIGYLVRKIDKHVITNLLEIGGGQICPATSLLEAEDVVLAKEHGLEVRAWGVTTEVLMQHAIQCEVDGMTVNFPDKLAQYGGGDCS